MAENKNYESAYTGPQFDEAVGRAIAGGAIDEELNGKAPGGYGLGRVGGKQLTSADDINNIKEDGFYSWYSSKPANSYEGYMGMVVYSMNVNDAVQELFPMSRYKYYKIVRHCNGGVWGEWEWVNPPMITGVEYRTTERYNDKPVYAQRINVTVAAQGTASSATVAAGATRQGLVRWHAQVRGYGIPTNNFGGPFETVLTGSRAILAGVSVDDGGQIICSVLCPGRDLSGSAATFTVYYTKDA